MSKVKDFVEYVIAPGETILELLEVHGMTQLDLANKTGINKKTINEIIKGKAPITTATALKLEYVFNIPASFWNNLESEYRESIERKKDYDSLVDDEVYLENIPYAEMARRNWVEPTRDVKEKIINLRKFFSVASLSFDTELKNKLAFRKSNNDNFSFESLLCWIRYGEIQSSKDVYPKYNEEKLSNSISEIRDLVSKPFLSVLDEIKSILTDCGISLVYEPHLPNTYVNGVAYKMTSDKAIIMISDRGKKDDILWFTLFHEIGHLLKHSKKEIFVDQDKDEKNDIELEADEYSRNVLINDKIFNDFVKSKSYLYERGIKAFAKENNISTGIVVGRLQKEKYIGWNEYNNLITRIS